MGATGDAIVVFVGSGVDGFIARRKAPEYSFTIVASQGSFVQLTHETVPEPLALGVDAELVRVALFYESSMRPGIEHARIGSGPPTSETCTVAGSVLDLCRSRTCPVPLEWKDFGSNRGWERLGNPTLEVDAPDSCR